jgi:hypothetical protein
MRAESEADAGQATAAQPGRILRPKPARDQRGALALRLDGLDKCHFFFFSPPKGRRKEEARNWCFSWRL